MRRAANPAEFGPDKPVTAVQADGHSVVVPDAHLLFTADFTRLGGDLLLSGADGARALVTGYFTAPEAPVLQSPDGAVLTPELVAALVGPLAPGQYAQVTLAQAPAPIGQVETLTGTAQAVRAGASVPLNAGDSVFQGDVVQTGPGSKLVISFADESVFSLTSNARITLDRMVYDPDGASNSMLFSLIQGVFTFVTGQVAATGDMKVNTPVVTMGIRGTTVHVTVDAIDGEVTVSLSDGFVEFFDPFGNFVSDTSDTTVLLLFRTPGLAPVETPKPLEILEEEENRANEVKTIQRSVRERTPEEGEEERGEAPEETPFDVGAGPAVLSSGSAVSGQASLEGDEQLGTDVASSEDIAALVTAGAEAGEAVPTVFVAAEESPNAAVDQPLTGLIGTAPILINNKLNVSEGETVPVTGTDLSAIDPDGDDAALVFTVSDTENGRFELVSDPGVPITSFTQAQIDSGEVVYVHDGSDNPPSYEVTVSDGTEAASGSPSVTFTSVDSVLVLDDTVETVDGTTLFADTLIVGQAGAATLNVINGGLVAADSSELGVEAGASGTLNVTGGSSFTLVEPSAFLVVGQDGTGVVLVDGGSSLTIDGLGGVFPGAFIGGSDVGDTGTGTVTVTGPGSSMTFTGDSPFIHVGRSDTGTLNVLNGGTFSGAQFMTLGRLAGSTGTVNLSGPGSSITLSGIASAAAAAATATVNEGQGSFLTVGALGTGTLNISDGGTFRIETDETLSGDGAAGFSVGGSFFFPGAEGALNVDGAGSQLIVDANETFFAVGSNDGVGELNITNGGQVILTGGAFGVIGQDGTGTVTVDGVGSVLTVGDGTGDDSGILRVGDQGGSGTFTVSGGATFNAVGLEIGRGESGVLSGIVTITDPGTTVNLNNDFGRFAAPFEFEGGFLRVARNDGDVGELNVLNGAVVNITSGAGFSGPGLQIARSPGSIGTVLVDNATVNMIQTDVDTASGGSAFLQVGRGGQGTLTIQNGGSVNISSPDDIFVSVGRDDGSLGTLTILNGGNLNVDSSNGLSRLTVGENAGSNGTLLLSGAGSELSFSAPVSSLALGNFGTGVLQVTADADITGLMFFNVGRFAGGNGTATFDGAGVTMSLVGVEPGVGDGAFMNVGRSGTGTLNVINGATIVIDGQTGIQPGFQAGRNVGGNGTIIVDGVGSSIAILSALADFTAGFIVIGRSGTGDLQITNGGTVTNAATGVMFIGGGVIADTGGVGGVGTVLVEGTAGNVSTLNAGDQLVIGLDYDFTLGEPILGSPGGTGTLTIGNFGTVNANEVFIGTDGTIQGTGAGDAATATAALNATTITLDGGTIAPGFSAGTLTMDGDFTMTSGTLEIELGGLGAGLSDLIDVSGEASLLGGLIDVSLIDGYVPVAGDTIAFLTADQGLSVEEGNLSVAVSGVTTDFQFDLVAEEDGLSLAALVDAEQGNSTIFLGGALDDSYSAGAGDDLLEGGGGDDTLLGGAGDDTLIGGPGADRLSGGEGADTFVLGEGDGGDVLSLADLITDFEDGLDLIGLEGGLQFSDLTVSDGGTANTAISVAATGEVLAVIEGVTEDLLDNGDFIALA